MDNENGGGNLLSRNGFEVLADLEVEEKDLENQVDQNLEVDIIPGNGVMARMDVEENRAMNHLSNDECFGEHGNTHINIANAMQTSSNMGSSNLHPPMSGKKGGKGKVSVTKEYFLRNKPTHNTGGSRLASSPPHDTSYTITSNVDNDALASMRFVATKSWADQCEEEENPLKHGLNRNGKR